MLVIEKLLGARLVSTLDVGKQKEGLKGYTEHTSAH